MNREILFRAKRLGNGEWVSSGNLITFNDEGEGKQFFIPEANAKCTSTHDEQDNIISFNSGIFYKVDPNTVGQYTGRKDKNGKKVFEHDILQLYTVYADGTAEKGMKVVVRWLDNDQCYVLATKDGALCDDFGNLGRPEYYEIIGNIHDNPELLNQ